MSDPTPGSPDEAKLLVQTDNSADPDEIVEDQNPTVVLESEDDDDNG